jgi:sugar lactone lactonase YvrE
VNISLNVSWSENATTIAGQSNGASGSSTAFLNDPTGMTITTDDILYVADRTNDRVVIVNLITATVIGTIGSGLGSNINQFNQPTDLFIIQNSLYVLDKSNYRLQMWSTNGTNPSTLVPTGSFGYDLYDYMFIDKYSNIYISSFAVNKVIRFAPNSSAYVTVAGTGSAGSQLNQLYFPYGIYVDDNLTLYVADYNNNRIQMWKYGASTGLRVAGDGTAGSSLMQVYYPTAIIVDINGYMYILEDGNVRVVRWAPNSTIGVCIAACTLTTGANPNQIINPYSIAFDRYGSLYVTDSNNNRVQKFEILYNQSKNLKIS